MLEAFSGSDVRAAEAPFLDAGQGDALMQRAAHALAGVVVGLLRESGRGTYGATVVVLAGSGNNGADALYAGERLARRGASVTAVILADRVHEESLRALERAGGTGIRVDDDAAPEDLAEHAAAADVVIDGILGIGADGGLRGRALRFVQAFTAAAGPRGTRSALVVACDLPSGIGVDDGRVTGTVLAADATVTFGAPKPGLLLGDGAAAAGELNVVDLGLSFSSRPSVRSLLDADVAALIRRPTTQDHKYSRGVLGVAAGSARYPGAAVLAVGAALATGIGMVRYLGPEAVAALVHQRSPEAVASTGPVSGARSQAWLVGPGAVDDDEQRQRAADAIGSGLPVVVDAEALTQLPERVGSHVILTPHAGELSRLLAARGLETERAEIESEPARYALLAAEVTGATVLLKGFATTVAAPSGALFVQRDASPWLAAAGSGDTLSGIVGALAASLDEDDRAADRAGVAREDLWAVVAAAGALIHGRAGLRAAARGPVVVSDLPADIGPVIADLLEERRPAV